MSATSRLRGRSTRSSDSGLVPNASISDKKDALVPVMESASGLGRLSNVVGGWSGERCGGRVFGEVLVVGWL